MLILNRRGGESIQIGDDVCIVILSARGGHVRLGVTAPKTIPVHRQEVYDALKRRQRLAEGTLQEENEWDIDPD
jgi:carbon storage regulator